MGNPWNSPSSPVTVGLCEMKGDRVRGHRRVRREEGETKLNQEWIYIKLEVVGSGGGFAEPSFGVKQILDMTDCVSPLGVLGS